MSRRLFVLTLVALVLGASPAAGQKPDFTGRWSVDASRSEGLRDDERETMVLVIRQSGNTMVVDRIVSGKTRTITYALDGSESRNNLGSTDMTSRSQWDGAVLVTEGVQVATVLGFKTNIDFKERRRLDPDGTMVVETVFKRIGGEQRRKAVFKRAGTT